MTYDEIHPTMRAFLGGYEGLRKLGYEPDEIFCAIGRNAALGGALYCFVKLVVGDATFLMDAGPVRSPEAFAEEYYRVVLAVNGGEVSQGDLDRIWRASPACTNSVGLVAALMAKGFNPAARRRAS